MKLNLFLEILRKMLGGKKTVVIRPLMFYFGVFVTSTVSSLCVQHSNVWEVRSEFDSKEQSRHC